MPRARTLQDAIPFCPCGKNFILDKMREDYNNI